MAWGMSAGEGAQRPWQRPGETLRDPAALIVGLRPAVVTQDAKDVTPKAGILAGTV